MNGTDIIAQFEKDTGDTTELSSSEELTLANRIYNKVLNDRDWEFLKKPANGTITIGNGVATIPLPADFDHFAINAQATDMAVGVNDNGYGVGNASPKVIFVSTATGVYAPYQIVNFSDRRQYFNKNGYCYTDYVNNQVVFTVVPTTSDLTYEFDYIYLPPALTLTTSPVFPKCHDVIHFGMAVDDMIIQLFDRTHSYAAENGKNYQEQLSQLRYYNSQLINN